jgi:hypothetical protein
MVMCTSIFVYLVLLSVYITGQSVVLIFYGSVSIPHHAHTSVTFPNVCGYIAPMYMNSPTSVPYKLHKQHYNYYNSLLISLHTVLCWTLDAVVIQPST